MKSIPYGDGLTIPAFDVPTTDKSYWLMRLCYQEVLQNEALRAASITIKEPEFTDVVDAEIAFRASMDTLTAWLSAAVQAAQDGDPIEPFDYGDLPDLVQFLAILVSGHLELLFPLFVKVGLKFVIDWITKNLPKDSDVSEVSSKLTEIFLDKTDPLLVKNRIAELCDVLETAHAAVNINFGNEECDNIGVISPLDPESI